VWDRCTTVHSFDSQLVILGHVSSLAHDDAAQRMERDDGSLSVNGETSRSVVHHTVEVVFGAKVSDAVSSVLREVVLGTGLNVFPHNSHELIAIVRRLHVMESQSVNEFMDNGVKTEASTFRDVGRESEKLPAALAANVRRAAGRVSRHLNVIGFGRAVDQSHAVQIVDSLGSQMDVGSLFGVKKRHVDRVWNDVVFPSVSIGNESVERVNLSLADDHVSLELIVQFLRMVIGIVISGQSQS